MSLYVPDRHEQLHAELWSEDRARHTITEIAADAVATFSPDTLFPAHPMDELNQSNGGCSHYIGAGGVLWALDYLCRRGYADVERQWLIDGLTAIVDRVRAELEGSPMRGEVSYLFGELPLLLQLVQLTGSSVWRERAIDCVETSVAAPVRELMWGTPGVLIATRLVTDGPLRVALEASDRANVDKLFDTWNHDADGITVWRQELYGGHRLFVGRARFCRAGAAPAAAPGGARHRADRFDARPRQAASTGDCDSI